MQKITEITETRFKTTREKDAAGKKIAKQVPYKAYRNVNVISGGKRFAHAFIDGIVYYVFYYFVEFIYLHAVSFDQNNFSAILGSFAIGMIFLFAFPLYYMVFEHFFQRTPGKFLTKAVVVDEYGNNPDIGTNLLRNIIRLVPFECFSCLFSERGWHDRWSGTFVISEEEYLKIKELLSVPADAPNEASADLVKPVSSQLVKRIFIWAIIPLSIVFYIYILYRSYSGVDDALQLAQRELRKANKTSGSEEDEVTRYINIYNNGNIDEAQEKLLKFTKAHKNYYLAWTVLGHTYLDQDKYEEAMNAYKNAAKVNKNAYEPHNGMGLVYAKKEDYTNAKREYSIADSLHPNDGTIVGNLASLYDDLGDLKRAIQLAVRSVQLDSTNATLSANLAFYYHKDKQFKLRNKALNMAIRMNYSGLDDLINLFYPEEEGTGYLKISGTITYSGTDSALYNISIEVTNQDSVIVKKLKTDNEGNYDFSLPLNDPQDFMVKVSGPLYPSKLYLISTKNIPVSEQKTKFPRLEADLGMGEIVKGIDYSFLNKPLNRYYYDPAKDNFVYDKTLLDASIKRLTELRNLEEKARKK